jgi:hypothetical protein
MEETWFRFEDKLFSSGIDEFGQPYGPPYLTVQVQCLAVAKVTPKGVRLCTGRFVLREGRKRWACPTLEEALQSFIARKKAQRRIYLAAVNRADRALSMVTDKTITEVIKNVNNGHYLEKFLP